MLTLIIKKLYHLLLAVIALFTAMWNFHVVVYGFINEKSERWTWFYIDRTPADIAQRGSEVFLLVVLSATTGYYLHSVVN